MTARRKACRHKKAWVFWLDNGTKFHWCPGCGHLDGGYGWVPHADHKASLRRALLRRALRRKQRKEKA